MAILRAGPWGNLNSPHEDEPAVKDDETNIYPVNCARSNWTNQPWLLLYNEYSDNFDITTGTAALGSPIVANGVVSASVFIDFNWQATEDFDVDLQWDITSTDASGVFPTFEWQWETIEGTSDSLFDTPTDSGSDTITLPASTFGTFRAYVDGVGNNGVDVQTEASIT